MPAIFFVFISILFQRANTIMLQSINPLFVKYVLDVNLVYVGVTAATYSFSTLIVRYLLSVRVKPAAISKFITAGLGLFCVAILGYFISGSFPEFLFFVILSGFATAIIMPFLLSLVHIVSDKAQIEKNLTIYSIMLSLALVFGPILGSGLLSVFGIRYIYLMLFVFGVTAFLFSVKINKKIGKPYPDGEPGSGSLLSKGNIRPEREDDTKKTGSIKRLLQNRGFLEVIFYNTSFSICFASIVAFGGVYAREMFHAEYFEITLLFTLFFVSSLVARLALLRKTRSGPVKHKTAILNLSLFVSAVSFAMMVISGNIWFYALSLILLGIPHALIFPVGTMRISEVVDIKDIVAANTIYQSNFDLGGIIGPFLLSYLGEMYSIKSVFVVITVFLLAAFIGGRFIKSTAMP